MVELLFDRSPRPALAKAILLSLAFLPVLFSCESEESRPIVTIGSKTFTESVILGEAIAAAFESQEVPFHHRRQLGGTRFVWNALLAGDIDAYPEYTGTLLQEILAGQRLDGMNDALTVLDSLGLAASPPLGFNNSYAIGMREDRAEELGITTVSDLRRHPRLRFGFSNEFMDRADGWPSLRDRYRLPQSDVRGVDHDLAYRGLATGSIDVIDLYSTDAEIDYYGLRVLEDDLQHFPEYRAVILYRKDLLSRIPEAGDLLGALVGSISDERMIAMNRRVKIDGESERDVARAFVDDDIGLQVSRVEAGPSRTQRIWRRTVEHLVLVGISLGFAIVAAIPLGVVSARRRKLGQIILGIVGIIYTIPSLALLVFMIPLIGIGGPPAIVALFLYSLLPIVRNTYTGLTDIPRPLSESAVALGLDSRARLVRIELPLASRSILGGIKTSAVINIGTATLGALIGAGGYGQPILTGIRLDDVGLILEGAVPAALMALTAQGLFDLLELVVVPRGLRLAPA